MPRFLLLPALLVANTALAPPAAAIPVAYTMQATLALFIGSDDLHLDGATLMMVATADTDDLPVETASDLGFVIGRYSPSSLTATFSNRPGAAADVTLTLSGQLVSVNAFPPSTSVDVFSLQSDTASFEGTTDVVMPGFNALFLDQDFFSGTGVAPLPLFAPGDLGRLIAGIVEAPDRSPAYNLTSATLTAVPEPTPAISVALGLVVLGIRRRTRSESGSDHAARRSTRSTTDGSSATGSRQTRA